MCWLGLASLLVRCSKPLEKPTDFAHKAQVNFRHLCIEKCTEIKFAADSEQAAPGISIVFETAMTFDDDPAILEGRQEGPDNDDQGGFDLAEIHVSEAVEAADRRSDDCEDTFTEGPKRCTASLCLQL